jgi:hypothetical protein
MFACAQVLPAESIACKVSPATGLPYATVPDTRYVAVDVVVVVDVDGDDDDELAGELVGAMAGGVMSVAVAGLSPEPPPHAESMHAIPATIAALARLTSLFIVSFSLSL